MAEYAPILESKQRRPSNEEWPDLIDTEESVSPTGKTDLFREGLATYSNAPIRPAGYLGLVGESLSRQASIRPTLRNVVVAGQIGLTKNGARLFARRPLRVLVIENEQTFTARVVIATCNEGYGTDLNYAVRALLNNIVEEYEAANPAFLPLLVEKPNEAEDEAMFEKHASPQTVAAFLKTMQQMPVAQKEPESPYTDEELGYA